ncbi:MAG: aldose epimerase [Lentimonas sp.]
METIDYHGVQLYRWDCGPSSFLARPEAGARLMNWNLRMGDGSFRDVIHWPENADYQNFAKVHGGNPILFPFAARTFNKGTIGKWKDQEGVVRSMPMHGFSKAGTFEMVAADDSGFTAELKPTEADRELYPFNYRFTVRYVFEEVSFKVYLRLDNLGDQPILWSAGHHFYFTMPWHEGLSRDDYRFEIPAKKCFTHAPDGSLQSVAKGWESNNSFGDPENSGRIYTRLKGDTARFGPNGGEEAIGIRILNEDDCYSTWNTFVIWTEKSDSPFYCVEPWMGPPNSPEHGKGLHAVSGGESATFGVEVALL